MWVILFWNQTVLLDCFWHYRVHDVSELPTWTHWGQILIRCPFYWWYYHWNNWNLIKKWLCSHPNYNEKNTSKYSPDDNCRAATCVNLQHYNIHEVNQRNTVFHLIWNISQWSYLFNSGSEKSNMIWGLFLIEYSPCAWHMLDILQTKHLVSCI